MNRGVDTRVVVASGALALLASLGCAGQDLAIEARRVREQLRVVREHGAYHCAPRQLARAETQVEFAERELDRGEFFRAEDHLLLAEMSVAEANRLSPASRCAVQGPPKHPPHVPELPEPAPRIDRDEDGIPDAADRCPTEPEDKDGFEDDDGCPDPDNDLDGVLDTVDRCPTEPEDKDGFEDDDGCPDPDNDQDGVADAVDKCPTEPGPASTGGCPVSFKMIAVTAEKIELKQAIFFASNKATILSQSYAVLDEVAEAMRVRSSMSVRIEGHTDGRGARDSNLRLSQARAEAVRAYLVGKSVDAGRLETKGYGPDHPIDSNKTAAGRDRNRRVDFFITQQ
jgi:outer membrane protein OmpA-like peptidoglycan-associated protein